MQAEHRPPQMPGRGKAVGAKQDPGKDHGDERQRPGERTRQAPTAAPPEVIDHQIGPVQTAPGDKGPGRAMPQSAQQHGDCQGQQRAGQALAIAAEGDVQVVAQKAPQGDVPAAPEVRDRDRLIGAEKIQGQAQTKQQPQADRHVRIRRKIKINLQGVGQGGRPGIEEAEGGGIGKGAVCPRREAVGDHHLLEQADAEDEQPGGEPQRPAGGGPGEGGQLGNDLAVLNDRSGHQLRKEGDKQRVAQPALIPAGLAAKSVDQIGDLLEGDEAQTQRQNHPEQRIGRARQRIDFAEKEVRVLVKAQQSQVQRHPGRQPAAAWLATQALAQAVIDGDTAEQQRQIADVPGGVKEEGGGQ